MKRYIKIYSRYFSMAIKSKLMYRGDWFIGLFSLIVSNVASFFTIYLSIYPVQQINNWTFLHIVFLYGFLLIPMGIDHALTNKLWNYAGGLINSGELDRILMKPLNPLFQMCAEYFQEGGIGEIILGIVFMSISGPFLNINFTFNTVFPIIIGALFSPLIYFAIKLFGATLSFYKKRSMSITSGIYNLKSFGQYPGSVYSNSGVVGKIVYNVLLFILSFSLVGYLPLAAQIFPDQAIPVLWFSIPANNYLIMWIIIFISLTLSSLSYLFFKVSLKHYSSSGS